MFQRDRFCCIVKVGKQYMAVGSCQFLAGNQTNSVLQAIIIPWFSKRALVKSGTAMHKTALSIHWDLLTFYLGIDYIGLYKTC